MRDYSVDDVVEILRNLDETSIDEDSFRDTKHAMYSNNYRNKNLNLMYDALLNKQHVGVLKSNYNSFKIFYKHPSKKSKDLCIVIAINDNSGVSIITTYLENKERRVRTYERQIFRN